MTLMLRASAHQMVWFVIIGITLLGGTMSCGSQSESAQSKFEQMIQRGASQAFRASYTFRADLGSSEFSGKLVWYHSTDGASRVDLVPSALNSDALSLFFVERS